MKKTAEQALIAHVQKDLVTIKYNDAVTTSLLVAEIFDKRHDNVIRDIENIIKHLPAKVASDMFRKSSYKVGGQERSYPMYLMTFDGFSLLAMGFTGKKALEFKLYYIKNKPSSFADLSTFGFNPSESRPAYVYVLGLDNKSVKIGRTVNLYDRFNQITNASGLTILEFCHSVPLEHSDACRIESSLKRRFSNQRLNGEFFDAPYEKVKACLSSYAELSTF